MVGLAALISALHQPALAAPETLEQRRAALTALFDDYWQDNLKHAPEFASTIGDPRYDDRIADYSWQAFNAGLARERTFARRLRAIDPRGFTEQQLISRELLLKQFAEDQEAAKFKEWEMPLNQMDGIYSTYPQLVAQLRFDTVRNFDDWIARLHAIPHAFDQTIDDMQRGIADHRVPPTPLLEKALVEVENLANQKPEDSPLAMPLREFPDSIGAAEQERIKRQMLAAVSTEVLPAYLRLAQFLKTTYLPAGRSEPGISALADGAAYYDFLIKRTTTTDLSAARIHQIGLDEVAKDETAMLAIAKQLGFADLATLRAGLKDNPRLRGASREQLLDTYRGYLGPMQAKLPELFGRLPKAPFEVKPVPQFMEQDSAPAYYQPGTPDGSRPGQLFIDTYQSQERNLYAVEAIAYHEGLPGHHLQISIAQELTDVPEFRKFSSYTAYQEGWGLYAERLGKDVGFYRDPTSDYGRLEADIWRAIRLVVDTGVHSQHWTRAQMVDFFHAHSAIDEPSIQAETDRYIAWPSQALAYKIGQLKLLELRARAQQKLGAKFDFRSFHDQVLGAGALPLDVLERRIDAWLDGQTGG